MNRIHKKVLLAASLGLGALLAIISLIVFIALGGSFGVVLLNFIFAFLVGVLSYFVWVFALKVLNAYYPESKVRSFILFKKLVLLAFCIAYVASVVYYYSFDIAYSIQADDPGLLAAAPILALLLFVGFNLLILFALAVGSFAYNKAVLLEKIEKNTREKPELEELKNDGDTDIPEEPTVEETEAKD